MSVLLHISDTHFGTEQPLVANALVTLALQLKPDLVVLSGDITQRASTSHFQAARAFVSRLGAPVLGIPGNHDIALFNLVSRLLNPYARYKAAFGDDLEPVHSSNNLLVVCVNTTRRYRHIHGQLSQAQIQRVAALLGNSRAKQLRVVVVHQPIAVVNVDDAHNLLRGHRQALQSWSTAGADVILGGHIHLPYATKLQELARPLWVVQAGTALSRRVRPGVPNSVNVIRWEKAATSTSLPDICIAEQWDFDAKSQVFHCAKITHMDIARLAPLS
jgi:3',5'-cyclic AMP phosphodiesterase CpdA